MISLYGMIRSYVLDQCRRRHDELIAAIERTSTEEKPALEAALEENDKLQLALVNDGWIGDWEGYFPLPMKEKVESMIRHLGEDFLVTFSVIELPSMELLVLCPVRQLTGEQPQS